MPFTTTKPYAIVPAQPTASIEVQGIAVNQQGTPVISPQIQLGYSSAPYIQAASVAQTSGIKRTAHTTESWAASKSSKFSTVSVPSQSGKGTSHQRISDEQTNAQLDEIGKKIGDAFANSSEHMLIAAFEDAWKKFQANGKRYQVPKSSSRRVGVTETSAHPKSIAPPNAEVVSVPGTSSRLSLIRPTYSRSKIAAMQSSPDQLVCAPADSQTALATTEPQKQQQVQFVYYDSSLQPQVYTTGTEYAGTTLYAIAPNNAQPSSYDHIVKQAPRQGKSVQKQIQSSGIYIPGPATDVGVSNKQTAAVVLEQVSAGGPAKSVVQVPRSQQQQQHQMAVTERVKQPEKAVQHLSVLRKPQHVASDQYSVVKQKSQTVATGKVARQCALCTKEATYLCSGCHRIWYCGRDCQLKAWDKHSENCKS
jgi:hypothetical protein